MPARPTLPMPRGRLNAARGITQLGQHRYGNRLPTHGWHARHGAPHQRTMQPRTHMAVPGRPCHCH
eukprot:2637691-Lingulodinium_polyedra.AAC.1